MKTTLQTLIDNGLLENVGQILINEDELTCRAWAIEGKFLFLYPEYERHFCFLLTAEVILNGFDLHIVEERSKVQQTLRFQKLVDIDPESFLKKTNQ